MVQDDAELLYRSDDRVERAMKLLARSGVRAVRLTASWSALAPSPTAAKPPAVDSTDPAAYQAGAFERIDRAVRLARENDMAAMIDIAFWAPVWATAGDRSPRPKQGVSPGLFGLFAQAVGRRYSGDYTPPGGSEPLPAVRNFTLWNEPNLAGFLGPQWEGEPYRSPPASPHLYRLMVADAYPRLKRVQPKAVVLVGGLAAYGHRTGVPPLRFVRELACVDEHLAPLRRAECANFRRIPGEGFAYHPYSTKTLPDRAEGDALPDDAPIGRIGNLTALLDRLVAAGRLAPGLRNVYLTEYGYETNPPDTGAPFGPEQAAQLWAWAEAIAARDPRVLTMAQFLVRDLPGNSTGQRIGKLSDWQSGIQFVDGRLKPLAGVLPAPLYAEPAPAGRVRLWGRVRPGDGRRPVRIEADGRRIFDGETDPNGVVTLVVAPAERFRLLRREDDRWITSPAVAGPPRPSQPPR